MHPNIVAVRWSVIGGDFMVSLACANKHGECEAIAADLNRATNPRNKLGSVSLDHGKSPTLAACTMVPIPGGTVWGASVSGASGVFVCKDAQGWYYFVPGVLVFAQGQAFKTLGARGDSLLIDENPERTVPRQVNILGVDMKNKSAEASVLRRETRFYGPPPFGRVTWRIENGVREADPNDKRERGKVNYPIISQSFTDVEGLIWASMKDNQDYARWIPRAAQEYVHALSTAKAKDS